MGENVPLPTGRITVRVSGAPAIRGLALDGSDRAAGPLLAPGAAGAVPGVVDITHDTVTLDPAAMPPAVQRLLVIAAVASTGTPMVGEILTGVTGPAGEVADYACTAPGIVRSLVLVEVYRRGTEWKLRAVGQGFAGGLPELLAHHGARPADVTAAATPMPAAQPAASAGSAEPPAPMLPPGTTPADRQVRVLQGVFQDAARSTAGFRSSMDFARTRRDRELEELLADPRMRDPQDPARLEVDRRYDDLVMQATSSHMRDIDQLRTELAELDPQLPPQLAPWGGRSWQEPPGARPDGGMRVGELTLEEAPELRVPLVVPLPLYRPLHVDGPDEAALMMTLGLIIRLLAGSPPGGTRVQLCDAEGSLSTALAGGPIRPVLAGTPASDEDGMLAVLRRLEQRADLFDMARDAGAADALPPDVWTGRVLLVLSDLFPGTTADQALLDRVLRPGSGVSLLMVGRVHPPESLHALRLPATDGGSLTDGWVGLEWSFRPDPGPGDPELAATLLRRLA
ncbi:hypothetical protein GIS00_07040 [Nakamurella sp. YIM 132087]|uniref:TerD domain-containing protein n=1 Tax=Nakamurella alba TaxID=2665158 RepID=A0A7K1FHU2_9ACTN|nr:TerD family protein [Nakamurella alba]MTD13697.1 hypothetical protein [Nakamurella alba]